MQPPHSSNSLDKSWTCHIFPSVKTWHLNISPPLCHQPSQNLKTLMHSYTCAISEGDQSEGLQVPEEIWQKRKRLNFTSLKKSGSSVFNHVLPEVCILHHTVYCKTCNAFTFIQLFSASCIWKPMQGWTVHMSYRQLIFYINMLNASIKSSCKSMFISNCSYTHKYFPVKCLEISVFHGQFLHSMQYKVLIQNIIYLNFLIFTDAIMFIKYCVK